MDHLNTHLIKALDNYNYDLEATVESLTYALSYDGKHPMALCLMGRLYAEVFKAYETAKDYFKEALAANIYAFDAYPYYLNVLLWNEDYDEAAKFIAFALTVKGSDKGELYLKKAILSEQQGHYKEALKTLKDAKKYGYNTSFMDTINEVKTRIKSKLPKKKKTKKKSKKR